MQCFHAYHHAIFTVYIVSIWFHDCHCWHWIHQNSIKKYICISAMELFLSHTLCVCFTTNAASIVEKLNDARAYIFARLPIVMTVIQLKMWQSIMYRWNFLSFVRFCLTGRVCMFMCIYEEEHGGGVGGSDCLDLFTYHDNASAR